VRGGRVGGRVGGRISEGWERGEGRGGEGREEGGGVGRFLLNFWRIGTLVMLAMVYICAYLGICNRVRCSEYVHIASNGEEKTQRGFSGCSRYVYIGDIRRRKTKGSPPDPTLSTQTASLATTRPRQTHALGIAS